MSFNFGTPKTVSGFTLPTTTHAATPAAPGFQFGVGGGDTKSGQQTKSPFGFGSTQPTTLTPTLSATSTAPSVTPGASFNSTCFTPQINFATPIKHTSAPVISFSTSITSTTTPISAFNLSSAPKLSATATTSGTTPSSTFAYPTAINVAPKTTGSSIPFSLTPSSTVAVTATTLPSLTTTATIDSAIPATGNLTFGQLEDAINKWTIDLEEQGKLFGNQARQLNAWDRLLISNSEKILTLNSGIERVKQQQEQLDQELDFVLAQQKELEDLIMPLEKELNDIPATDLDRNQTYQMAENLDSQLKQMSEDLKEVIEHLNEANKNQELSNPITQIGKILNAHMNSLQWIERNTSKISSHLDQITKMHDKNRRNHEMSLQRTYD